MSLWMPIREKFAAGYFIGCDLRPSKFDSRMGRTAMSTPSHVLNLSSDHADHSEKSAEILKLHYEYAAAHYFYYTSSH